MDKEIKIIKSEKSWIESSAIEQLKSVTRLNGMVRAVGLPDLHMGKTPVGASFITKEIIYPHIVGNDIGCGMALFSTGINRKKFKIPRVMKELQRFDGLENIDISHLIQGREFPFKDKLGTIGSGNHFAEFQEIDEIYDENAAGKIGIDKSNILLLIHSGSRSYGEHILRSYIEKYSCQKGLEAGSQGFREYLKDHKNAVDFAALNRELIAYRLMNCLNSEGYTKLLDSVHNSITVKEYDGEAHYIHRKGAAPSDIGYVVVAGSRGTRSYIVEPIKNLEEYGFSISHGAGRKWSRFSCKERLEGIYSKKDVRQNNLSQNLVCKDKNLFYEEAPEAYKNIDRVIDDMLKEGMIRVVAGLKPLVTYKV